MVNVMLWNKQIVYVYFLSFTIKIILNILTLFYKPLITTISCFDEYTFTENIYQMNLKWIGERIKVLNTDRWWRGGHVY